MIYGFALIAQDIVGEVVVLVDDEVELYAFGIRPDVYQVQFLCCILSCLKLS